MRKMAFIIIGMLIIQSLVAQTTRDSIFGDNLKVYRFEIFEDIAPSATRKTGRALDAAVAMDADLIILHLNTYGGLVTDADSIRTRILNSPIPIYVFVENNAASAGALISIACSRIFMKEGASIGAATVVDGQGGEAPDKYQSYMRSKMRATATARGRDPEIAEAMVDGNKVVPGLNDSGDVVTLTADEAMKWGYCEGKYPSIEAMLAAYGIKNYSEKRQQVTWIDKTIGFLLAPAVSGALILLILGGIYYELRTPGIGFPLLVSAVATMLYFAPLYLEGLAANWEILLFIAGLGLLGVEIFVLPGFGVAGISGLALMFSALVLSAINNVNFDFTMTDPELLRAALLKVCLAMLAFIFFAFLSAKFFVDNPIFRKWALETELGKPETLEKQNLVGLKLQCVTDLKPFGYVEKDGQQLEAKSLDGYVEKGRWVTVVRVQGNQLVVEV